MQAENSWEFQGPVGAQTTSLVIQYLTRNGILIIGTFSAIHSEIASMKCNEGWRKAATNRPNHWQLSNMSKS